MWTCTLVHAPVCVSVRCVCVEHWVCGVTTRRRTISIVNASNLEAAFHFDSLQDLDLDPEPVVLISAFPSSGVLPPKGVYVPPQCSRPPARARPLQAP